MKNLENDPFLTHFQIHYEPSKSSFLSIKEVSNLIGISVSTINRGVEKEHFRQNINYLLKELGFLNIKSIGGYMGKRDSW